MTMRPIVLAAMIAGLAAAGLIPASGDLSAAPATGELFKGFKKNSKDPVQIDAETLEIFEENKQRISVFSGGVIVKRGDTTLRASTIKLYSDLANKSGKEDDFSKIEALGTVYVNSGRQTATGDSAVVDMKAQTITLIGDVVLSEGKNIITGDRLVVDMATGHATVEQAPGKRIQGIFTPRKEAGAKKEPAEGTPVPTQ